MISYYELLGMIKKGNNPEKVKYDHTVYEWDNDSYYYDDYDNISYLSKDIIFEKDMFKKNIEIIEDKKIEKIKTENNHVVGKWKNGSDYCYTLSSPQVVLANKINEIIEVLNEKEKIQDNKK